MSETAPERRPDRWTQHHHRCGLDLYEEMASGFCCCPPGWPRTAAWWKGEMAVGARKVEALIKRWREERDSQVALTASTPGDAVAGTSE